MLLEKTRYVSRAILSVMKISKQATAEDVTQICQVRLKVKVKLRFSAPSAGIAGIAQR